MLLGASCRIGGTSMSSYYMKRQLPSPVCRTKSFLLPDGEMQLLFHLRANTEIIYKFAAVVTIFFHAVYIAIMDTGDFVSGTVYCISIL